MGKVLPEAEKVVENAENAAGVDLGAVTRATKTGTSPDGKEQLVRTIMENSTQEKLKARPWRNLNPSPGLLRLERLMSFSEDLSDIVTVSAEVHAEELRVDESRSRTRQGVSEVERTGIEPSGAIPAVHTGI